MYRPLHQAPVFPLISRNQFLEGRLAQLHLHLRRSLLKLSTERRKGRHRRLKESSVPARKRAMQRRHPWKKTAMCRWRLHPMRI